MFPFAAKWFSLGVLLTAGSVVGAKPVEPVEPAQIAPIAPGAIVVDGKLEEPVYAKAIWNAYHQGEEAVTRFSLHLDGEKLYLSAEVRESQLPVVARQTERDGPLSGDDSIEVFLQCGPDVSEGIQWIVNADGVVADYYLVQGGLLGDRAWNAGFQTATQRTETGWSLEAAVPLAELGLDPSRKSWGLQVATNRAKRGKKKPSFYAWNPVPHNLREFGTFGTAVLPADAGLERFAWNLIAGKPAMVRKGEEFALRVPVHLTNATGSYRMVRLQAALEGERGEVSPRVALATSDHETATVEIALGKRREIRQQVTVKVSESGNAGRLLAQVRVPVDLGYTSWKLQLIEPGYRETIFATQKLDAVRARLELQDPGITPKEIKGSLVTQDGDRLPATVSKEAAGTWEVVVPGIAKLPDGEHRLEVSVQTAEDKEVVARTIRKLPYQKGEVWIDHLGIVRREGVAIPFYGYCFGQWDAMLERPMPGMRVNVAAPVGNWTDNPADVKPLLAKLGEAGVYSMPYAAPAIGLWRQGGEARSRYGLVPIAAVEPEYRAFAEALKGNPNVVAYYLADEPELRQISPERLREIYNILSGEDPYKPCLVLNNTFEGVKNYLVGADISMPDRYPVFRKKSGSSSSLARITTHLQAIPVGEEPFKARWTAMQAMNYEYYKLAEARDPTAREMRSQQIAAMIGGVSGITWFTEQRVWDIPAAIASLSYLSKEFEFFFSLREKQLPREPQGESRGLWGIFDARKDAGTGPVVMVVNTEWKPVEAVMADRAISEIKAWKALGTKRTLALRDGRLALHLEPHESAILVPETMKTPALDWLAVEKREEEILQTARSNTKNIAGSWNGATTVSIKPSPSNYRYATYTLIDGMKEARGTGYQVRKMEKGAGAEIHFPKKRKPRRIAILGTNAASGRVETFDGKQWTPAATFQRTEGSDIEVKLEGREALAFRVLVDQVAGGQDTLQILEIEAYE
ncbi:MAG TPA: sugar-binding protein [Chthoniobacteraceae bacterium]|nr:sugar-binding protein [Chthoniobacteraceae bacterium]